MDSLLRPIGREPTATYWRRRALLLVLVLVTLFVASRACGGEASGEDGALRRGTGRSLAGPTTTAEPSASPTATTSPTGTAEPTGEPTGGEGEGQPTEQPTGGVAGGGVVPGYCQDGNIRVSIKPTRSTFPSGQDATFRLTILNVGSGPCRYEVGPRGWEATVESGHTRIWNSDDCAVAEESTLQTLQPIDPVTVTIVWDRIRSEEGCPSGQPAAAPGTYTVVAKAGNVSSQKAIFVLSD